MTSNRRLVAMMAAVLAGAGLTGCAHSSGPSTSSTTAHSTTVASSASSSPGVATVPPSLAVKVPTGRGGVPRGGVVNLNAVDQGDPTSVAIAMMRRSLQVDTEIDAVPLDAERRAAPLFIPKLAAIAAGPVGGNGGVDASWITLSAHHGYTTVAAAATPQEGQPADTATTAVRSLTVTVTSHGDHGWHKSAPAELWILTLTREVDGWRVQKIQDLGAA